MPIEFELKDHYYELDQIMDHIVNYHGEGSNADFLHKMSLPDVDIDVIKVFMEHLVNDEVVDVVPKNSHWDDPHFFSIKRNHRSKPFLEGGGYTTYYKNKAEEENQENSTLKTIHNHGIYNEGNTNGNQSLDRSILKKDNGRQKNMPTPQPKQNAATGWIAKHVKEIIIGVIIVVIGLIIQEHYF